MQRVPSAMFQELQQQRTSKDEAESGRGGGAEEGRAIDGHSTASEPSFSRSADRTYASSPSPPTSFVSDAEGYSRLQGSSISRGGSGRPALTPQISFPVSAQKRPGTGPRTPSSPSRTRAAETVSSQLLGGRVERNAGLLAFESSELESVSNNDANIPNGSTGQEHSRPLLSPTWTSRDEVQSSEAQVPAEEPSSQDTPSSGSSNSPLPSPASQKSHASSFAYLLRDNRADKRLLKKKSKPSEHLQEPPQLKPPPAPKRSASYYKPKVVQDTADSVLSAPPSSYLSSTQGPTASTASSAPEAPTPIRKARVAYPPSESSSLNSVSALEPTMPHSQNEISLPPSSASNTLARRRARFDLASDSSSRSRDSSLTRQPLSLSPRPTSTQSQSGVFSEWSSYPMTPPESEPTNPFDSTDNHGDHYFRMFGTDTIYQRTPSPTPSQLERGQVADNTRIQTPVWTSMEKTNSDTAVPTKKRRKSSSVFSAFRSGPSTDSSFDPNTGIVETLPTPQGAPGIKVTPPQSATSPRSSHAGSDFFGSYFGARRHQKKSSEASPPSAASGLSTHWEDVVAESQPTGHVKEISDPISPLSLSPKLVRPKPKRAFATVEDSRADRPLPKEAMVPAVPSGPVVEPQPKYKSANGEEYHKASLTGPDALSFLPSEMTRVNTPPLRNSVAETKKPMGFKGFFFDMRSLPTEQMSAESESPQAPAIKRRSPIVHKNSLRTLLPKLSIPTLKRKASRRSNEEPEEAPDPLAVTGFQQTPYSQRYGDARRAKITQIRSYMDEALKDDEDETASLGFEINVPDHLPSSPLCPLNPKHKSGGKAICPIHRRKKTKAVSPLGKNGKNGRSQEPMIVYDSGQAEGTSNGGFEEFRKRSRDY